MSCTVGVTTNGTDPKWKSVCVLSGYHNRTIYDVHWYVPHTVRAVEEFFTSYSTGSIGTDQLQSMFFFDQVTCH